MPEPPVASDPALFKFSLGCDLKHVRQAAQAVHRFLSGHGCDEETMMACDLALVEGCNNAIKYAPETARAQPVLLEAACDPVRIELRITDHTAGFDWPARVELPDPESESGRGLYLMQSLMDYVQYQRGRGENILVMRKNRPAFTGPGAAAGGSEVEFLRHRVSDQERVINGMLDELSSCYESLSAIFRYGAQQGKIGDLKEFALYLLTDLVHIVGADWFVFRVAREDGKLVVLAASEPALEAEPLDLSGQSADSLEIEAALSRRAVWFDEHRPLKLADPLQVKLTSRGLVRPVFVGENFVGTLAVGRKAGTGGGRKNLAFDAGQENVVATFAHFLAIQVLNSQFHEEQVRNQIIAREVEIAGSIQQSLLLKKLPELPGLELAAHCRSANQVGGDFYDVLKTGEQGALLVIADVMGKGVLAAMFAAILRTVLRAAPELTRQPSALLTRVNELMYEELSGVDMFITAQLVYVDAQARRLVVGSAGHCPLLLAGEDGEVKSVSPEGMPLGILPDTVFVDAMVELPKRCRVLLYTDGLIEALNARGERFGQDRLINWLGRGPRSQTAGGLKQELAETLGEFQTKTALNDDQTFLIMTG